MSTITKETVIAGYDFERLNAGIGYDSSNPFTDPAAEGSKYNLETTTGQEEVSDFYTGLIPAYLEGDFSSLYEGFWGSKPMKKKNDETPIETVGDIAESVIEALDSIEFPDEGE